MKNGDQQHQRLLSNISDEYNSISSITKNPKASTIGDNQNNDTPTINGIDKFFKEFFIESEKLWFLAGPAIFTQVCLYTISAIAQIFAGQLGTIQLAAISVESSVLVGFSYSIIMGMSSALETLCGQAYGAKQYHKLGIYLQRSCIILNITAFAISFLFIFATPILKLLGQTAEISKVAGDFALLMIPQQFAYASVFPVTKFLLSQSKVMVMVVIAMFVSSLSAFFNWLLMLKLGWGLIGAAITLNSAWWFIAVAQFLYAITGSCDQAWSGFSFEAFHNLWGCFKLSVSSAIMFGLELWYTTVLMLCAGFLADAEVSVNALSICFNISGFASMVSIGINMALSVRVANELGSRNPRSAKFAVMVGGGISLLIGLLLAMILIFTRKKFPAIFSTSNEVRQLVEELTPLLAISIVFTNLQYSLSGVAVGAGWQSFVAFMKAGCYFFPGVPIGILLAIKFDMGVQGLWYGLVSGLCLQTCLLLWVILATNWDKEADNAADKRIQWEDRQAIINCNHPG